MLLSNLQPFMLPNTIANTPAIYQEIYNLIYSDCPMHWLGYFPMVYTSLTDTLLTDACNNIQILMSWDSSCK